ncbi:serine/threonine-protein kinase [Nocardia carnea]|uniref:serine/threonine-protein kinase n=1 Tax=Nocardia carnea TaxID=37328 RepID=UPI002454DF62|nr:serine/threonine-protein kinase [Nocardia carnea]
MTGTWDPGTMVAGYRIERVLGGGGMGTVYLAAHPRLPRHDALKVLAREHGADPEFRARFLREAELLARLDHPNIVAVRDRGTEGDHLWLAMQFVDGIDAAELLRRHPGGLSPAVVAHIAGEVARGLDEAHRAGLLHRDVKPANILLEARPGGPDRVYVTDFGIARPAEGTSLTETGTVLATLAYAAPEQLRGAPVDLRADVYSLGCTLYELLFGSKPFPYTDAVAMMQAHLDEPPPRPAAADPRLPPGLDEVFATALAKDPARRYQSCGALARALEEVFTPGSGAPPPPNPSSEPFVPRPLPDLTPPRRSRRAGVLGVTAAIVVVLMIAGLTVLLRGGAGDTTESAAPGDTTAPAPGPGAATWGQYGVVVAEFPDLLPPAPISGGYQGIRCEPVNREGERIEVSAPLDSMLRLACDGNADPVVTLSIFCNGSRTPTAIRAFPDMVNVREEAWERPTGRGRVIWGDSRLESGKPSGTLIVQFDDLDRNFCSLIAMGGISGQEIADRWWRDAPL